MKMFSELKDIPKSKDWTKPNPRLESAIELVKSKYPNMFLQSHELKERKFFDEPYHPVQMASFLYPVKRLSQKTK
jgi:hypothetical protein